MELHIPSLYESAEISDLNAVVPQELAVSEESVPVRDMTARANRTVRVRSDRIRRKLFENP